MECAVCLKRENKKVNADLECYECNRFFCDRHYTEFHDPDIVGEHESVRLTSSPQSSPPIVQQDTPSHDQTKSPSTSRVLHKSSEVTFTPRQLGVRSWNSLPYYQDNDSPKALTNRIQSPPEKAQRSKTSNELKTYESKETAKTFRKSNRPSGGIFNAGTLENLQEEIELTSPLPTKSEFPTISSSSSPNSSTQSEKNILRRSNVVSPNTEIVRRRAGTLRKIQLSENNSELVALAMDEKFTLHVKRKIFRQLLEKAEKNPLPIAVISFAGATHAGKSTLITTLLSRALDSSVDLKSPAIGAIGSIQPTTGNINVFDTENPRIFPNGIVRLLDLEGSNASSHLPLDMQSRENFPPQYRTQEQCTEFMNRRNEYVRKDFPRLAYLISNIVVFLTQVDFANNSTIKDILEFSESTITGIQHSIPPFLIVIQNKVHTDVIYTHHNTEEFTQKWLQSQDPESLLVKRFRGIRCFLLPFKSLRSQNNIEIFEKQMTLLEEIMKQQIEQHLAQIKKHHGLALDNGRWLQILQHTVDNLRNEDTTQFSEMVTLVENLGKEPKNKAWMHFQTFYHDLGPSVKEATRKNIFFKHVEIAIKTLVYCLVVNTNNRITNNLKTSGKTIFDPGQLMKEYVNSKKGPATAPPPSIQNIIDTFEKMWESQGAQARFQFLKDVEGQLPCFKVHNETGKMCVLSLIEHEITDRGVQHRTERVPVTQDQVQGWLDFQRFFSNLLLTRVYVWEDSFENFLTKDTYTSLAEKEYEQYRLMNSIELILERSKQLQSSFEIACRKSNQTDHTSTICLLCMENSPHMKLDCSHKFCTTCLHVYEEAIRDKNLNRKCPLCSKVYKSKLNSLMSGIRDFSQEIANAKKKAKAVVPMISNQCTLQDFYWKGKEHLASGEFSESYLVQSNIDNRNVCIKEFTLTDRISKEAFFRQIAVLSSSDCPYIVKCLGVILEDNDHPKIVTEYCSKGDLKTYLHTENKLDMIEYITMAKSIAMAIDYLHSREVAHGQVTLSKVLIGCKNEINEYKLGDSYSACVSKTSNDVMSYGKLLWLSLFFPHPYDIESPQYEDAKKSHPNIIQIIKACEDPSKPMKDILAMLQEIITEDRKNSELTEKHNCLVEIELYKKHPSKDGIQKIMKQPVLLILPEILMVNVRSKVKAELILGNFSPELFDGIENFLQTSNDSIIDTAAVISVIKSNLKLNKMCSGIQTVCGLNSDLQIVQVHKSENWNNIYYKVGKVVANTIEWPQSSIKLESGENPSISMKSNKIVIVYETSSIFHSIYYKIGMLQYPNIEWDSTIQIGRGISPTVAIIDNGIIILYEDKQQNIISKIGQFSQVSMKMKYTDDEIVCEGKKPSLAINDIQSVVICFTSKDKMMIKTGKLENATLKWLPTMEIPEIGSNPRVAITQKNIACIYECQMSVCLLLGDMDHLCNIRWISKYILGSGILPNITIYNPILFVTCEKGNVSYYASGCLTVSGLIKWFD